MTMASTRGENIPETSQGALGSLPISTGALLHTMAGGRCAREIRSNLSNLQNHADSVIFRLGVCGFRETPASISWYDRVAKRPDTDEDNKDAGDVAEGDTIHILAPHSRRTSALARRCDGRSADCASPALRQRARPGSDRDVPAKLVRACRAPARRARGPGPQLHCQGGIQPANHPPADRHAIGRQDIAPPVRL